MKRLVTILVIACLLAPGASAAGKRGLPAGRSGLPDLLAPMPDPVAEYLLDGDARDTSANANHAIVQGAQLTEDRRGRAEGAYIFYAPDHRIRVPRSAANTFSDGSFTVSFWVQTRDTSPVMKGLVTNTGTPLQAWGFFLASNGKVLFSLKNRENQHAFIVHPIADGKWHQVTGVRDAGNNTLSLYVDGRLVRSATGVTGSVDSGSDIWLGDHRNLLFTGRLDEVRMWGSALSEDQLSRLHARDTGPLALSTRLKTLETQGIPAPVAAYTFDGNAEDSSGNANHAIVTGAEPTEDRAGKPDSAYLFYERPHHIRIPLTDQNAFGSGSFTASFWIRTADEGTVLRSLLTNDSGARPAWGFHYTAEKQVMFLLRNQEGESSALLSGPIGDGKWHHVTGTRNAQDRTMSLSVDSSLVGTRTAVGGSVNSLGPIHVGDHQNRLFIGRLDDVMLWDRAFSPDKLSAYHAATAGYTPYPARPADTVAEPVGIYLFSGNAADSSSQGNNARVTGAYLSADRHGRQDSAYCFSDRGQRIEIPLITANTFSKGSFTVAFWVKLNQPVLVSLPLVTNQTGSNAAWSFSCTAENKVLFSVKDKERFFSFVSHRLDPGAWHHVVGVRDAQKKTITLYVDSRLAGTRQTEADDVNSGGGIWVGDRSNLLFNGCIDDVMLWKRSLSGREISDMHRKTVPFSVPDRERAKPIEKQPGLNPGRLPGS
ncbi:MAG TPA: LamG domain-containing protein [Deltaproteobacteria bacterium]|nr:LamG domain-containing protein [Deltaproteobacteria bacterium]HQI80960.1 LamG domain-containing protein [Deltaproteobacteria bacterium]